MGSFCSGGDSSGGVSREESKVISRSLCKFVKQLWRCALVSVTKEAMQGGDQLL